MMDATQMNGLSLAYIGDAVYETYIRKYVLGLGYQKVDVLHKHVVKYTSGQAQAKIILDLINNNVLNEEEIIIYKRGRNSHIKSSRKNISIQEYLEATGFEALIGYLYLTDQIDRLDHLIDLILKRGDSND